MRVNVTVASESSRRGAPARWVRATTGDIRGNARVGEDPNVDSIASPLSGINATAIAVESVTIGAVAGASHSTASIFSLIRSLHVAVAGLDGTAETGVVDRATIAGVQSKLVRGLIVDTFNDINLAIVRPV